MAPRRASAGLEDSRSETSSGKEKHVLPVVVSSNLKVRRNGPLPVSEGSSLRVPTSVTTNAMTQNAPHDPSSGVSPSSSPTLKSVFADISVSKIVWSSFDSSVLHAYRQSHRLNTPSTFSSANNQRILSRPGISQLSPTMTRHKNCRRVGKEHLALAIRKDFNAAMIHELEAITSFLYTVRNQGELTIRI